MWHNPYCVKQKFFVYPGQYIKRNRMRGIAMKQFLKTNRFLSLLGILLLIGFIIRLWADYYKYSNSITSEPFYVFVIGRSLVFLLPSIICFIAAAYYKNKDIS